MTTSWVPRNGWLVSPARPLGVVRWGVADSLWPGAVRQVTVWSVMARWVVAVQARLGMVGSARLVLVRLGAARQSC